MFGTAENYDLGKINREVYSNECIELWKEMDNKGNWGINSGLTYYLQDLWIIMPIDYFEDIGYNEYEY